MTYETILLVTLAFIAGNFAYQFLPVIRKRNLRVALERSFFQGVLGVYLSAHMYFDL